MAALRAAIERRCGLPPARQLLTLDAPGRGTTALGEHEEALDDDECALDALVQEQQLGGSAKERRPAEPEASLSVHCGYKWPERPPSPDSDAADANT